MEIGAREKKRWLGGGEKNHAGRQGLCSGAPGQAQCASGGPAAFGGGAVTFAVITAVGLAHGRHGSIEIIYTFTRHACNNAATAMPGPWTQRHGPDPGKKKSSREQSAHCVLACACTWLPPPRGSPPALPATQAHPAPHPSCALRVAQPAAVAARVRAAHRSDTRVDFELSSAFSRFSAACHCAHGPPTPNTELRTSPVLLERIPSRY